MFSRHRRSWVLADLEGDPGCFCGTLDDIALDLLDPDNGINPQDGQRFAAWETDVADLESALVPGEMLALQEPGGLGLYAYAYASDAAGKGREEWFLNDRNPAAQATWMRAAFGDTLGGALVVALGRRRGTIIFRNRPSVGCQFVPD